MQMAPRKLLSMQPLGILEGNLPMNPTGRSHAGLRYATCLLAATSLAMISLMTDAQTTPGAAATPAAPAAAPAATDNEQASALEEVVVTGTNIRGEAPVGEPIVDISRQIIEETAAVSVQQLLETAAPQVNGFGSSGQTTGSYEPRLRSLGGSSSAATLVLIDGHRIDPGGGVANTGDPNIVPAGAVDHIEILADGAAAVYGSDAVAGVINIVTRQNYDGFEVNGQGGIGSNYNTKDGGLVFGHSWDSGSVLATYEYAYRSDLLAADRSFVSGNQSDSGPGATGKGGTNFNTFACSPATAVPGAGQPGAGLVFAYPYTGTGLVNNSTINGLCSTVKDPDLLPAQLSNRLYFSLHQSIGERVKVSADVIYANSQQIMQIARGTVTNVAVYGPGSTPPAGAGQINPFFVGPPGVTSEKISYDFDQLLGSGASTAYLEDNFMATVAMDVDLGHGWSSGTTITIGDPKFTTTTTGAVCQACAIEALNGTAVASGVPTTNLVGNNLGTVTNVTRLPLTSANAFNPFAPGAPGTSQAVLSNLTNSATFSYVTRPIDDIVEKIDGSLFDLPGGTVKTAFGVEDLIISATTDTVTTSPVGQASTTDAFTNASATTRIAHSAYAEFYVPLVGESMNVPLVHKLTVDIAGRLDHYSDLANDVALTKNPKFGLNWEVTPDLKVRGAFGTSFVAPTVGATQIGTGTSTITSYFGNGGAAFTLPQGYPNSGYLGCPAVGTCTITSGTGKDGIVVFGGNPNLQPMTGREWSAGLDWRPMDLLKGIRASLTYWGANYFGVITNQTNVTVAANTPGLEDILIIDPTAAQIASYTAGRTATTPLPSQIYFINNTVQANYYNFKAQGLDFDVSYSFDTQFGTFYLDGAGEVKTKFTKQIGTGPWVNALNIENSTNTFSPVEFAGRGDVGWRRAGWRADLFANYVGNYYDTDANAPYANSPCPDDVTTSGLGCQHVGSYLTFDTHVSYTLGGSSLLTKDLQVFLDVTNILNRDPPFVDATDSITGNGSLNVWANPIGRLASLGFRKKF
jgi:iron complex outermembrane receptor protein